MPRFRFLTTMVIACFVLLVLNRGFSPSAFAGESVLWKKLSHVRSGMTREWADFPETAEGSALQVEFSATANSAEQTLRLRHQNVKQTWILRLNNREIGRLPPDENDMVTFWAIPPDALRDGDNVLVVSSTDKASDDVFIGDVRLIDRSRGEALGESRITVGVRESPGDKRIPCRLTIVDAEGALMTTDAVSNESLAVRPGVIYTATGLAEFRLPAGKYTLYAGRGFEYSVAATEITLLPGESAMRTLQLEREVPTAGYVACDTHCHTFSLSRHGDSTMAERVITVAGEGIELPIAADHNIHADYEQAALAAGVRPYFTPVTGNEVTTPHSGHFNIFPIAAEAQVVDQTAATWPELFGRIRECPRVAVTVLNHPRDLHGGYRPFGPEHQLSLVGENLDGWILEANALEAVNSGALQTDPLRVYRDWFGLLNRGLRITSVGASDSHDVARYILGQGRTYIRCDDREPGAIDVANACKQLAEGHALVSFGLMCEMTVNREHSSGDLVAPSDHVEIDVRVLGPRWTKATHVELFANGLKIREAEIGAVAFGAAERGIKWKGDWRLPKFKHDVHLVAIATGPGVDQLFWPTPRPYQPSSPVWHSYVLGSTGPVWIDADGSGQFNSAFEYANRVVEESKFDIDQLMLRLADYDEAVAAQAARVVHVRLGKSPADLLEMARRTAAPAVRNGFQNYVDEWKASESARLAR